MQWTECSNSFPPDYLSETECESLAEDGMSCWGSVPVQVAWVSPVWGGNLQSPSKSATIIYKFKK